jgi:hypothetical protein
MFADERSTVALTAVEIRGHLAQLLAERALALGARLAESDAYMADLDEEIEATRRL